MSETESKTRLNKTLLLAGVQCARRMHLLRHPPEGFGGADAVDELRFLEDRRVHKAARKLYPHGVLVDELYADEALRRTRKLVRDSGVRVIFEAAFEAGGVLVRADILERLAGNRWRLLEVKSSTKVSARHLSDLAVQRHVLQATGLTVDHCGLVLLDRHYEYDGARLNVNALFRAEDLTAQVRRLGAGLPESISAIIRAARRDGEPQIPEGVRCQTPARCEFHGYCFTEAPDDHISLLPAIHARHAEQLRAAGIDSIRDIPDDFPLRRRQQNAREALRNGQPWFSPELSGLLEELRYPLCFMDFETYAPAIPRYGGMRPYDQLPFQWSVHIQRAAAARIEHFEYLADNYDDPRGRFIGSLLDTVGEKGSIVVYNQSFESSRLRELAERYPSLAGRVEGVRNRLWDLLPAVRRNVYHAAFRGSFSIKAVLPALAPEMTYAGMEVGNGVAAQLAWVKMVDDSTAPSERHRLRQALLAYCRQDTLAMVHILNRLKKEARALVKTKSAGR